MLFYAQVKIYKDCFAGKRAKKSETRRFRFLSFAGKRLIKPLPLL